LFRSIEEAPMTATITPKPSIRCRKCHRVLRSAASIELGLGPTCHKKVIAEARAKAAASAKPEQFAKAVELIRDGGVVPLRPRVWRTVASKGTGTYLTAATNCNCPAGLRGRACYQQTAVQLLAG
jgi:hypothetical protein